MSRPRGYGDMFREAKETSGRTGHQSFLSTYQSSHAASTRHTNRIHSHEHQSNEEYNQYRQSHAYLDHYQYDQYDERNQYNSDIQYQQQTGYTGNHYQQNDQYQQGSQLQSGENIGRITASKTSKNKLDKVQNAGLRIVLGAIKTPPITEMEKTADIEQLEARREYKALAQAEKAKRLPLHPLHTKLKSLQNKTRNIFLEKINILKALRIISEICKHI